MAQRGRVLNDDMRAALARVAPGTPLRVGIDRVVRAKAGALLVLDDGLDVLSICSGGFLVDAPYSPQRLSELAKMDGAIIISGDGSRIARANVHLVPDPSVPTTETGTRHRTAERVARSLNVPVVSASEEMGVINIYAGGQRHQLQDISRLLDRSNQALQTLERYKVKLDDAMSRLTSHELENMVTVRDLVLVIQRGEMVHRIADEIETNIVELGIEARLLRLQLDEIYDVVDIELDLVIADYVPGERPAGEVMERIAKLDDDDLLDARIAAQTLNGNDEPIDLDEETVPKGLRFLHRVPRLTEEVARRLADHFGNLAKLQRATVEELLSVEGVDEPTALEIRETLVRYTESAILDQYA